MDKKKNKKEENIKVYMYILPKQTRTVTCYMTDLSSCHGGCPATNKITTVLTTAKTWS
jgi:hypothetical protein